MPELTAKQRAELRRLAEAATPGEWRARGNEVLNGGQNRKPIVTRPDHQGMADADYIAAANPATVLSLLDALEAAEADAEANEEAHDQALRAIRQMDAEKARLRARVEALERAGAKAALWVREIQLARPMSTYPLREWGEELLALFPSESLEARDDAR